MKSAMFMVGAAACALATACASTEDVRALRRPTLPPTQVALADPHTRLYESIAIYEINGVPEFRLFDGGSVITTQPTRADVASLFSAWLDAADMLAPNIHESRYLLSLSFDDVRGPDVIWFTDKHARATVTYTLSDRRTREPLFTGTYEAHLQARMPGVTPEMVRAGIASGLLGAALGPAVRDSNDIVANAAGLGALLGVDSAAFASSHDTLLWDWPEMVAETLPRLASGFVTGAVTGALVADGGDAFASDQAVRWRGAGAGALIGTLAAAPTGRRVEHWDSTETLGAFDGTQRRGQAVRGMLRQNFNRFLFGLAERDLLHIRDAVSCSELNPYGYGSALITRTQDAVGYNCPIGRTRPVRPAS